jgi:hypothetical protein
VADFDGGSGYTDEPIVETPAIKPSKNGKPKPLAVADTDDDDWLLLAPGKPRKIRKVSAKQAILDMLLQRPA